MEDIEFYKEQISLLNKRIEYLKETINIKDQRLAVLEKLVEAREDTISELNKQIVKAAEIVVIKNAHIEALSGDSNKVMYTSPDVTYNVKQNTDGTKSIEF